MFFVFKRLRAIMKQTGWQTSQEMAPCLWVTGRGWRSDDRGIRAEVSQPRAGGRGPMKHQERWREPKTPKRTGAEKKNQV